MRRHPKRFEHPPVDPRVRRVVKSTLLGNSRDMLLELDCGHSQKRRLFFVPLSLICRDCPKAGGIAR